MSKERDFINNQDLQRQIVDYLHIHDYGNAGEICKIKALL